MKKEEIRKALIERISEQAKILSFNAEILTDKILDKQFDEGINYLSKCITDYFLSFDKFKEALPVVMPELLTIIGKLGYSFGRLDPILNGEEDDDDT